MNLNCYFHLRPCVPPLPTTNNLVIALSYEIDGPFFLFKKNDRHPEQHSLLSKKFKSLIISKKKSLNMNLSGPLLKTYYDIQTNKFRFNKGNECYYLQRSDYLLEKNLNYSGIFSK